MSQLVVMVEEPSMQRFLDALLPRLFPGIDYLCITHEGKSDLERSIPRKLRAWQDGSARFLVVRDNDGGDCLKVKARLVELCRQGRRVDTVVRIACQELEAWYLGDLESLAEAYGVRIAASQDERRFRTPDKLGTPSREVKRLVPTFQKVDGARRMGARLHPSQNRSRSFQVFVDGVGRLLERMPALP